MFCLKKSRSRKLSCLAVFVMLLVSATAFSKSAKKDPHRRPGADRQPNCFITVDTVLRSGESSTSIFRILAASEPACKKAARAHEAIFNPERTASKSASYEWFAEESAQ